MRSGTRGGRDRLLSALALLLLLALWWAAARAVAAPVLLPTPAAVLRVAWQESLDGALPRNVGISLLRVGAAFALSMALGVVAGTLAGRSRRIDALIDPLLVIALNLPALVVVILLYVWLGLNDLAAVLAVTVAKLPTVVVTVREGARALDPGLDDLAAVYRIGLARRLRRLVLPQLLPYLAAAGRSGLSVAWKLVLVAELLGRPDGVGFALNLRFQAFDVPGILAYGLAFAAVMLGIEYAALQPLERRARAWRDA